MRPSPPTPHQDMEEPFTSVCEVPVAGGRLTVARAGPEIREADRVVLALHGITASHVAWRAVARGLITDSAICVVAPDLRGRGASGHLPGPYGSAAHVADALDVLDHLDAPPVLLAGHSMGAYVAARLAAEHPERVSDLVLVDGGLPIPVPSDKDPDEVLVSTVGPALERLGQTYPTREAYVAMWRNHPAFAHAWNADVEAYVNYDLEPAGDGADPEGVRSVVSAEAVRTDGRELMMDEATRESVHRVQAPIRLLRAPRGLLDDNRPLIPVEVLQDFELARPEAAVEEVADTNHYTILLGDSPGPARVVAALRRDHHRATST
jgi:lipase